MPTKQRKLAPLKHHKPALGKHSKSPESLAKDSGLTQASLDAGEGEFFHKPEKKGKKKGKNSRDVFLAQSPAERGALDDGFGFFEPAKKGRREALGYGMAGGMMSPLARLSKGTGGMDRLRMKVGSADITRIVTTHLEVEFDALVQALSRRLR